MSTSALRNCGQLRRGSCAKSAWPRSEAIFDIPARQERIQDLEQLRLKEDFWSDPTEASGVEKEISSEKSWIDDWNRLELLVEDIQTLIEMAAEEEGDSLESEIQSESVRLEALIEQLELRNMLRDQDDAGNAIARFKRCGLN